MPVLLAYFYILDFCKSNSSNLIWIVICVKNWTPTKFENNKQIHCICIVTSIYDLKVQPPYTSLIVVNIVVFLKFCHMTDTISNGSENKIASYWETLNVYFCCCENKQTKIKTVKWVDFIMVFIYFTKEKEYIY